MKIDCIIKFIYKYYDLPIHNLGKRITLVHIKKIAELYILYIHNKSLVVLFLQI